MPKIFELKKQTYFCQTNLNPAVWLTQCVSNTYVMMVAFIHKIELRIEWIWQLIWPKNPAFTDVILHSRANGRSYHLLRLSSWLVTSDWGGGLVSYDAGTQLRSSVHHRCYGAHTHRGSPIKEFFTPMGKRQLVGGLAEPKWRISSIISFLSS